MVKPAILWALAIVAGLAAVSGARAASPAVDIERAFKDMETRLCQSIPSRKCKRKAPRRKVASKKTVAEVARPKPAKSKPAAKPASEEAELKWKDLPPLPKQKPKTAISGDAEAPRETVIAMTPPAFRQEPVQEEGVSEKSDLPDQPGATPPKPNPAVRVVVNTPEAEPSPAPKQASQTPDSGSCFSKLKSMRVDFLPQPAGRGSCSVAEAVLLRSVSVGRREVKLPDRPIVNCAFALKFAEWVKATGVPLSRLYTGPGYQCRGRNGASSGKLSEHGHGNAVDIERMQLANGQVLWVKNARSEATLQGMRKLACQHFTTVLGPGANAAHAEHFHLDLATRRGGYRICE
jgi:hypothetical protein